MKQFLSKFAVAMFFLFPLGLWACQDAAYCDKLVATASTPEVQEWLRNWVRHSLTGNRIAPNSVTTGDGVWPGLRWLSEELGENALGLRSSAHVRLVGPRAKDELHDTIAQNVKSIFFGDRSRYGIVVRAPNSDSFGLNDEYLKIIDDDIAVVCRIDE